MLRILSTTFKSGCSKFREYGLWLDEITHESHDIRDLSHFHITKNHWNKVWFRAHLLFLNKQYVRSLRATRALEHFNYNK